MDNVAPLPPTQLVPKVQLTVDQLQEEVKNLRLWAGELYMRVKEFQQQGEVPDAAARRMDELENQMAKLENLARIEYGQRLRKIEDRIGS